MQTLESNLVPEKTTSELADACAGMGWEVVEHDFSLFGFDDPPGAFELECLRAGPAQLVSEGGETTLLTRAEHEPRILRDHPTARVERELVWIRFRNPMAWDLVGFLSLVTTELARAGVPLGCVCGFSRDHLFIARRYLDPARAVLSKLFPQQA
jgi:hypothetical protein